MSSVRKNTSLDKQLSVFEKFPNEILLRIFDYLDPFLLLGIMVQVNKNVSKLVHTPLLWEKKIHRYFPKAKKPLKPNFEHAFIWRFHHHYANLGRDGKRLMSLVRERDVESLAELFPKLIKDESKTEKLFLQTYQGMRVLDYLHELNHQETLDNLYHQLMLNWDKPAFFVWRWLGLGLRKNSTIHLLLEWAILCKQPLEGLIHFIPPTYDFSRISETQKTTLLYLAAKEGYTPAVDFICKRLKSVPAKLEIGDEDGCTPLYIASQNNKLAVLNILLASGANPESVYQHGVTPIYVAAMNGNVDIVLALLNKGVDVDAACSQGSTPLYVAAQYGWLAVVDVLLDHGANVNAFYKQIFTPLYIASFYGCAGVVNRLLKAGAMIESYVDDCPPPLYIASKNGHAAVVKLLLEAGANPSAQYFARSSLYAAVCNGRDKVVAVMVDFLKTAMMNAGHINAMLNFSSLDGQMSLHVAARKGFIRIANSLIEGGADINALCNEGFRPIHLAAIKQHFRLVKLFLKNDALVSGYSLEALNTTPLFKVLLLLKAYIDSPVPRPSSFFKAPEASDQKTAAKKVLNTLLDKEGRSQTLDGLWSGVTLHGLTDQVLCQQLEQFSGSKPPIPFPVIPR